MATALPSYDRQNLCSGWEIIVSSNSRQIGQRACACLSALGVNTVVALFMAFSDFWCFSVGSMMVWICSDWCFCSNGTHKAGTTLDSEVTEAGSYCAFP